MKKLFIIMLLALCACGSQGPSPSQSNITLQKKDCVAGLEEVQKLVNIYSSPKEFLDALGAWALDLAHTQDCTINDETEFFKTVTQYLTGSCSKQSCEIQLKTTHEG